MHAIHLWWAKRDISNVEGLYQTGKADLFLGGAFLRDAGKELRFVRPGVDNFQLSQDELDATLSCIYARLFQNPRGTTLTSFQGFSFAGIHERAQS